MRIANKIRIRAGTFSLTIKVAVVLSVTVAQAEVIDVDFGDSAVHPGGHHVSSDRYRNVPTFHTDLENMVDENHIVTTVDLKVTDGSCAQSAGQIGSSLVDWGDEVAGDSWVLHDSELNDVTQWEENNLLSNGSFEEGDIDPVFWKLLPGWRFRIAKPLIEVIKPYVSLDDEMFLSGERSLCIASDHFRDGDGAVIYPGISTDDIPIASGREYTFSAWIKGDRPGLVVQLGIDGWKEDLEHWFHRKSVLVSDMWKKYSVTVTSPREGDFYYLRDSVYLTIDLLEKEGAIGVDTISFLEKDGESAGGRDQDQGEDVFGDTSFSYIPEDAVGDIKLYIDDKRFLRASYKGVNLLHMWGEVYTPLIWGFSKGSTFKSLDVHQPDNLETPVWQYLIPDIPIRVDRTDDTVEYQWSYSCRQSDFTGSELYHRFLPTSQSPAHLESDFRQVNRVEATANRITVDSTLVFLNPPIKKSIKSGPPSDKVMFYPVLFPGKARNQTNIKEFRILGTDCQVVHQDGTTNTVRYPAEINPAIWVDGEPRSLTFNLKDIGNVRYNFGFSDPDVSLTFFAHTGWPSPVMKPYVSPAIVGKIEIPVKEKFKDGRYTCAMRMEVVVGDAADKRSGISMPTAIPLDDTFDIRLESALPSHRFFVDDPLKFNVVVDGLKSDVQREMVLQVSVLDYENNEVSTQAVDASFPKALKQPLEIQLTDQGKGAFILNAILMEGDIERGYKSQHFCVIDRPYPYPSDKSFFGCMGAWMAYPSPDPHRQSKLEHCKKELGLLHDLGIKKMRWRNGSEGVRWNKVEKEQGVYRFPERLDKLGAVIDSGMSVFAAYESFDHRAGFIPDWARGGSATTPYAFKGPANNFSFVDGNFPTGFNFGAYEDYCAAVANHFRGVITTFETENEPNYIYYKDSEERQAHIELKAKLLSAAYRGIKRGNPDAQVVGGSLGSPTAVYLEWLVDLLDHAEEQGGKLFDIMAPHYLLRTPFPEDGLEVLKHAKRIADKYELTLWNGEDGRHMDSFHTIYPNVEFNAEEKQYVSDCIRAYLLQKSHGVEHVNICFAAIGYRSPWGLPWSGYRSTDAEEFFGIGGFIKPVAVAHAALANVLEGSRFIERVDLGLEDAWCLIFEREKEIMAALWMKEGKADLEVSLPKQTERNSIVGSSEMLSGGGRILGLTEEPFYLSSDNSKLIKALRKGVFTPDKAVSIKRIDFSEDRNSIEVVIKSFHPLNARLEFVSVSYGGKTLTKKQVPLPKRRETTVVFDLETEAKRSALISVELSDHKKHYRKEAFVSCPSPEAAKADGALIAVRAPEMVTVNGDLTEWTSAVPMVLNRRDQIIYDELNAEDVGGWKGPEDLSAVGYLMWDEQNVYFACKVTDDIHSNPLKGRPSTWKCDGIQMAFDPLMDNSTLDKYYNDDDQEINLALNSDGPICFGRSFGHTYRDKISRNADGLIPDAEVVVKKWEKGLVYECSIPAKELYPLEIKEGSFARFNFIVNEDDGKGRELWMGVTPGIGERKAPQLFKKVYFSAK